jgi:hypothetical protein
MTGKRRAAVARCPQNVTFTDGALPVLRLKGHVMAAGEFAVCGLALGRGDEEFVGPEVVVTGAGHRHLQHLEHGFVKGPAGGEVLHDQLDVVDQPASVQFLCFHR